MTKTLHGVTQVSLGEQTYDLQITLAAVRAIEARLGGLRGASHAVAGLSIDGMAHIISSGAGLERAAAELLPAAVFEAGAANVSEQLVPYIYALYNPRGGGPEGNSPTGMA